MTSTIKAFVPKPDRAAPSETVGVVGWLRRNLFKDIPNALMTFLGAYILYVVLAAVLEWAVFNAIWSAESRRECLDAVGRSGACWPGVAVWFDNLIYGLYPKDKVWRINIAFGVLILWLVPLWLPRVVSKVAIGLTAVLLFPFLASFLFLGGPTGVIWTVLIAMGGAGFLWVWATALSETYRGQPITVTVVAWLKLETAEESKQRMAIRLIAVAVVAVLSLAVWATPLEFVRTQLWGGLFLTLVISGFGITFSLPAGILLALGRRSKMPVISMLSTAFIELFRSVPLITILFMFNTMLPLFLPPGTETNALVRVIVAVCLFASAYMAEVIRGGLQAIPNGQYEAAASLGLGFWQTTSQVIMPQALKIMIPTIVGNFIGLFKDTTLVSIIGLFDLMNMARAVGEDTNWLGLFIEPFFVVALIYFVFCFAMSSYSIRLEAKLSAGRDRS